MAVLSNVYCMLILSRQTTISGDNCPIIPPHPALHTTLCQHGFNSEGLPRCHDWLFWVATMGYCRHRMKMATDTMANKFSDDSILVLVSNAMNDLQQQPLILYPIFCCDCVSCSRAAASPHAYLPMVNCAIQPAKMKNRWHPKGCEQQGRQMIMPMCCCLSLTPSFCLGHCDVKACWRVVKALDSNHFTVELLSACYKKVSCVKEREKKGKLYRTLVIVQPFRPVLVLCAAHLANFFDGHAWPTDLDSFIQAVLGHPTQILCFLADSAH